MSKMPIFKALWNVHTITVVGTNTSLVVIPLLAIEITNASVFQMSVLEATESLAVLLFGLFIGVVADVLGGYKSILVANILRALSLISIPIAYFVFQLTFTQVFIVVFLIGLGTLLYESALSKVIATKIPEDQWIRVNAYMEGSSSVTEVAGPGIGGLLVQLITAPFAVIFDSLCYFIGALGLIATNKNIAKTPLAIEGHVADNSTIRWSDIFVGVKHIFKQKILKSITLSAAQFNFFYCNVLWGVYIFLSPHPEFFSFARWFSEYSCRIWRDISYFFRRLCYEEVFYNDSIYYFTNPARHHRSFRSFCSNCIHKPHRVYFSYRLSVCMVLFNSYQPSDERDN